MLGIGVDVFNVFTCNFLASPCVPLTPGARDAVPGRLNETWFYARKVGVYYGQCSQLCGKDHAYMPIAVRVVSEQAFAAWVEEAKRKYAREDDGRTNLAAAEQAPDR